MRYGLRTLTVAFCGSLIACGAAGASDSLTAREATDHIGERATVCGTVASARYAYSSRGRPTFLNLDKPYPDHVFTIVIWGGDRGRFDSPPEKTFRSLAICATGLIEAYRGVPQMEVNRPSQIRVEER